MEQFEIEINTKQQDILIYMYKTITTEQLCPSVREIAKEMNIKSTATVQGHINRLVETGYIARNDQKKRSLRITDLGRSFCESRLGIKPEANTANSAYAEEILSNVKTVPLVGNVQAGMPITAIENQENEYILPLAITGRDNCFMLTVQGDSMKNIGIFEGDKLLVRQQRTAENGDIVVARIDDEATVKRFFKESDHIRLQPENDLYEPIIVKDCVIEGKVITLIRENM